MESRTKVSELGPGIYKVRIQQAPPLIALSRNWPSPTAHILTIKGHGESRTYQLDDQLPTTRKYFIIDEHEFEIVRKLSEPVFNMASIHLTWEDQEGDRFAFSTRDAWTLKQLFEDFPFLTKPFNYRSKRRT